MYKISSTLSSYLLNIDKWLTLTDTWISHTLTLLVMVFWIISKITAWRTTDPNCFRVGMTHTFMKLLFVYGLIFVLFWWSSLNFFIFFAWFSQYLRVFVAWVVLRSFMGAWLCFWHACSFIVLTLICNVQRVLMKSYTQNCYRIRTPPQFDVYSFSHIDINKYDSDVTGGGTQTYLFSRSISSEDPC